MKMLRSRDKYRSARFVFYFERNMSNTVTRDWANLVLQHPQINCGGGVHVFEDRSQFPPEVGVSTNDYHKSRMVPHANLFIENRNILIASGFVTLTEDWVGKWTHQMKRFALVTTVGTDPVRPKITRIYCGKSYGEKDDMVMAFLLCLYWSAASMKRNEMLLQRHRETYKAEVDEYAADLELVKPVFIKELV
jgi:hypothetical protein